MRVYSFFTVPCNLATKGTVETIQNRQFKPFSKMVLATNQKAKRVLNTLNTLKSSYMIYFSFYHRHCAIHSVTEHGLGDHPVSILGVFCRDICTSHSVNSERNHFKLTMFK